MNITARITIHGLTPQGEPEVVGHVFLTDAGTLVGDTDEAKSLSRKPLELEKETVDPAEDPQGWLEKAYRMWHGMAFSVSKPEKRKGADAAPDKVSAAR